MALKVEIESCEVSYLKSIEMSEVFGTMKLPHVPKIPRPITVMVIEENRHPNQNYRQKLMKNYTKILRKPPKQIGTRVSQSSWMGLCKLPGTRTPCWI